MVFVKKISLIKFPNFICVILGRFSCSFSESLAWRHLFYRGAPKSSKNKKNVLRTFPLVRNFPLKVAANFLEHSFATFIDKVSPFMPTWVLTRMNSPMYFGHVTKECVIPRCCHEPCFPTKLRAEGNNSRFYRTPPLKPSWIQIIPWEREWLHN